MFKPTNSGFTLIELLITITIIGILVAVAVPSYQNYTRRAHYTEMVQAAAPYKLGVEECFQMLGALTDCSGGKNGVPKNIDAGTGAGLIDSISVATGKIVLVPRDKFGIKAEDTYELTPTVTNEQLIWTSGGGGVQKGYAN
jgi:type IV pilus assembly protein PilA